MNEDGPWSLNELALLTQQELKKRKIPNPGGRVSQVPSARTIRYYTSLGLVDRPLGYSGGNAQYGPRHLLQLLAIKVLQSEYLPLPEIHKHLYGRSEEELRKIVESASYKSHKQKPTPHQEHIIQSWLTIQAAPGLRMIVEDREALLEWEKSQSEEQISNKLYTAFSTLLNPKSSRES